MIECVVQSQWVSPSCSYSVLDNVYISQTFLPLDDPHVMHNQHSACEHMIHYYSQLTANNTIYVLFSSPTPSLSFAGVLKCTNSIYYLYGSIVHIYICMYVHVCTYCVHVGVSTQCSLDPEKDPLCVLLMIDYYAVRAGEYQFLADLYHAWDVSTHSSHSCYVSYSHLYEYMHILACMALYIILCVSV